MKYNPYDEKDILRHCKKLEDNSLSSIYDKNAIMTRKKNINIKSKGGFGQLIESVHFEYDINSKKEADFVEVNIELKVVPLKHIKKRLDSKLLRYKKGLSVKERIVLSIINYMEVYNESWESNSLFKKVEKLLLVFYIYEKDLFSPDYIVDTVSLWTPSKNDLSIIKNDWNYIINKIKNGEAHLLSEGDTMYLGACTKGASSKTLRNQPFNTIKAKQRAFSYKNSYANCIYEEILNKKNRYEQIYSNKDSNFNDTLERIFSPYIGLSAYEIEKKFYLDINLPKNYYSILATKMMNVSSNINIEEFKKANIKLKTIRIQQNNYPKEDLSFPSFDFIKLSKENWEDSELRDLLENSKFLFIFFKINIKSSEFQELSEIDKKKNIFFEKYKLWNMPIKDIDEKAYIIWNKTKEIINSEIKINKKNGIEYNNFPNASENLIIHVRPHALNKHDTNTLPNGQKFTKQSFWINKKYIQENIYKI